MPHSEKARLYHHLCRSSDLPSRTDFEAFSPTIEMEVAMALRKKEIDLRKIADGSQRLVRPGFYRSSRSRIVEQTTIRHHKLPCESK